MDQHYDASCENSQKATNKGKFLKLPRDQKNLKYNFDFPTKWEPQWLSPMLWVSGLVSATSWMELNCLTRLLVSRAVGRWSFWSLKLLKFVCGLRFLWCCLASCFGTGDVL